MNAKTTPQIGYDWLDAITKYIEPAHIQSINSFVDQQRLLGLVYPPAMKTYKAFEATNFNKVKVIVLGQDPYHGPNQAHGLSFSVPVGTPIPPSLRNIFKELSLDIGMETPEHGNLSSWAAQGVLLLNAVLTVRAGEAGSHQNQGWEQLTDAAIQALSNAHKGLIFMLWGKFAQQKKRLIDTGSHHILEAPHPSPLSAYRGFFGCKHFSKTNALLRSQGKPEIDWTI